MDPTRTQHLSSVRSVVVKLGTQVLSDARGALDTGYLAQIADQVATLRKRGIIVTLVSSGAIGAGLAELKLGSRPTDLGQLQAVAAVGQRRLMDNWAVAFEPHGMPVAQILLTREDIDDRARFLNLRNTVAAVHSLGAVAIINENDTISTDELVRISFGDNDILAALVTHALRAELLVLLSVVDGILDEAGQPLRLVERPAEARSLVRQEKSPLGRGGFNSKLEAARMVTESGDALIVAHGRAPEVLIRLLNGEALGTLFTPSSRKLPSRSRWIGSVRPVGTIVIDEGAASALRDKNRSLLPAGITRIDGTFNRGDVVAIHAADGAIIGRGLSNYASVDVERIRGKRTAQIRKLLADAAYDEVIHRDNLVLG